MQTLLCIFSESFLLFNFIKYILEFVLEGQYIATSSSRFSSLIDTANNSNVQIRNFLLVRVLLIYIKKPLSFLFFYLL